MQASNSDLWKDGSLNWRMNILVKRMMLEVVCPTRLLRFTLWVENSASDFSNSSIKYTIPVDSMMRLYLIAFWSLYSLSSIKSSMNSRFRLEIDFIYFSLDTIVACLFLDMLIRISARTEYNCFKRWSLSRNTFCGRQMRDVCRDLFFLPAVLDLFPNEFTSIVPPKAFFSPYARKFLLTSRVFFMMAFSSWSLSHFDALFSQSMLVSIFSGSFFVFSLKGEKIAPSLSSSLSEYRNCYHCWEESWKCLLLMWTEVPTVQGVSWNSNYYFSWIWWAGSVCAPADGVWWTAAAANHPAVQRVRCS